MSSETATLLQSMEGVSESWKAFDWSGQQNQVEETLLSSMEAREQSQSARKQLAEATKQFKRSIKSLQVASSALEQEATPETTAETVKAVEALGKECRGIVSSYKEEIDNLTRRCKSSETAYSSLAQALMELTDPATVLKTCSEQMQMQQGQISQLLQTVENVSNELEKLEQIHKSEVAAPQSGSSTLSKKEHEELIELRRDVAEYEVEFRSLKNQDIKIRKLEARIAELQTVGEEHLKEQLEKGKEELAETEGRRTAEALEREAAMERKVQTLELQLKAERAGREASHDHLLEADEGVSRREAAWDAQRQILIGDTERLREELQVASRERDELRLKASALQDKKSGSAQSHSAGVAMEDLMLERTAYEAEVRNLFSTKPNVADFPTYLVCFYVPGIRAIGDYYSLTRRSQNERGGAH
jgi:homeobox protein cut-like